PAPYPERPALRADLARERDQQPGVPGGARGGGPADEGAVGGGDREGVLDGFQKRRRGDDHREPKVDTLVDAAMGSSRRSTVSTPSGSPSAPPRSIRPPGRVKRAPRP